MIEIGPMGRIYAISDLPKARKLDRYSKTISPVSLNLQPLQLRGLTVSPFRVTERIAGMSASKNFGPAWSAATCLLLAICQSAVAAPEDDFVTTWKTDNPGSSNSTSITVPMVGGPYDVDWENDGIVDEFGLIGPVTHDFGSTGTYTIRIWGTFDSIKFNYSGDKEKILSLDQWGTNSWTSMNNAFAGALNLTVPATDTPNFSAVTDMYAMFYEASKANPDTSGWNTSSVTDMSLMFYGATSANPNTSAWDTSAVTNMAGMFRGASIADPDTSGWDTSSVTDMAFMFRGASIADPDTSGWNTSAVIDMSRMFYQASAANPDVSGWNTSEVTEMWYMFYQAYAFDRDIGQWNVSSVTNATEMFTDVTLSTPNYESLLNGWASQNLQPGVTFNGGSSTYCSDAAATSRTKMINSDGWIITDGGQYCGPLDNVVFSDGFEGE